MATFTKNFKYFSILFLITALVFIPAIISAKIAFAETSVNQEINTLLTDYSNYLETGETSVKANYSPLMSKLVEERRTYYVEFFNKALHSTLADIKSEFGFDQARFSVDYEDIYTVRVSEKIRLQGEPKTKTPEDFPLILAAKWAITQTHDKREIFFLNQYIVSMETGVETSTANGVDITFVVQHEIDFEKHDGILIILNDTFSDKSNDNGEGFDKIAWTSQDFKRFIPDWRQFPDFEMYHSWFGQFSSRFREIRYKLGINLSRKIEQRQDFGLNFG